MKKFKVCFLQTEWSNEKVLRIYRKMTPNRSGIWKNMIGVTSIDEADYVVIIDYTKQDIKDKPAVYIGAHPYGHKEGWQCYDNAKNVIAKFDERDTFGFGEWWLEDDYDTLSALEPPKKTKNLISIISEKYMTPGHQKRRKYMEKFCAEYPNDIEIYGRIKCFDFEPNIKKCYKGPLGYISSDVKFPENFQIGKTEILKQTRYILEHDDNFGCIHYFSERFFDDLLMWCMPIYTGCGEIYRYLPFNCYINFDYNTPPKKIIEIANSDFREKHLEDIKEARYLLLNKYQLWARAYEGITGKS